MSMHCRVVVRSITFLCLACSIAAKCQPEKCGSTSVGYPFWINNSGCGHPGFQISCEVDVVALETAPFFYANVGNYTKRGPKDNRYRVMEIDYRGHLIIDSWYMYAWTCRYGYQSGQRYFGLPSDGPFTISSSNRFIVVGCNTSGTYSFGGLGERRCVATCESQNTRPYCMYGCCEIRFPDNRLSINFTGVGYYRIFNTSSNKYEDKCGFSIIFDPSTFRNKTSDFWETSDFWANEIDVSFGLRLNWGIGLQKCTEAINTTNYACASKAKCMDSPSGKGHVCKCLAGYEGNGYLNGTDCTDINECHAISLNKCVEPYDGGVCHNLVGSYNCSCAKGYKGDGFKNGSRCESGSSNKTAMFAATGSISAFVATSLGACGIAWLLRRRYKKHARDKYFRCNGGFLLERILAEKRKQGERKSFRIFSENELKSASKHYSDDMKLGSGGSSTVYKGILANGTAVAIKKFKEILIGVESEECVKQFINEIVILSGLHHKNIVSLVGCCMQTQSPLLVYEFVDGGTVSHQLRSARLSWQSRLQIAIGSAEALAYLHSELDHPIIHRDVKSTNILVDNSLTPKVADFGVSRLLCGNDTHLTTNVVGTLGYMDPEYFCTGTLTDKSDVYSFGVFLAELLTGREALSLGRSPTEFVLTNVFLFKCQDDSLTDILDPNVIEGNLGQMIAVASLVEECLCSEGNRRPSMKEVKAKLEEISSTFMHRIHLKHFEQARMISLQRPT